MTTKPARWSWVLALPLSAVLAAPAERAVEVPLNSISETATKPTKTTKSGNVATREAAVTLPDGDPTISHSIHDWVPRTATKASHTDSEPAVVGRAHRRHRVAGSQKAEEVKP